MTSLSATSTPGQTLTVSLLFTGHRLMCTQRRSTTTPLPFPRLTSTLSMQPMIFITLIFPPITAYYPLAGEYGYDFEDHTEVVGGAVGVGGRAVGVGGRDDAPVYGHEVEMGSAAPAGMLYY
eukprot:g4745.t1